MQSGSNPSSGFSFGTNPASAATSTPGAGFSFASATPSSGFGFAGTATTTKPPFSFATPGSNTTASIFNTPTTKPPAYGAASGSVFGVANTTTTGTAFGMTSTTPGAGLFSGTSAAFGSSQATTQNTASFGGQATQSAGLFSGSMAPTQQANGPSLFSARLPTATAGGGNTGFFSGVAAPATKPSQSTGFFSGVAAPATQTSQPTGFFSGVAAPATQTPQPTGFFSGVAAPATQTPQSTGFFSGVAAPATQTSHSTGLFSGSVAPPGGPPAFGGKPILNSGNTLLFSGVAAQNIRPGGIGFGAPTQAGTTAAPSFGSSTATLGAKPALTFGTQESATAAKPGFSFGTTTTSTGSTSLGTGVTFGGMVQPTKPTGAPTATTGFTLGGTPAATTQAAAIGTGVKLGGPTLGTMPQTTGGGFKLGGAPPTSQPGLTSGGTPATQATPGFSFGTTPASTQGTTQPVQGLGLGQSTTGFNFAGQLGGQPKPTATTTPASTVAKTIVGTNTNLVFAAKVRSTLPGAMPLLTTTSTAKPTLGLTLPQTSTTTSTAGLTFGGTASGLATTSTVSGFKLPTMTAGITGKPATSGTAATTTSTEKYTYKQLEDQVNKWNIELEDMEKAFLEQAANVNVADRELMGNGEKIAVLHNEVERAKSEQNRLDQELDFLVSQQNELEDLLKPLEESVKHHNGEYAQEPDREREKIYTMAEKCDGQLKGMVQDLKEVIDYLNSTNANQQQEDNPVIQIGKILNVHMDSLQWIDQNSVLLQKRVDEIARLSEMRRKEYERSFRLGFD